MSERIDLNNALARLNRADNILILSHKNPDGDTLGSAGALLWGLKSLDKTAAVFCADPIHERYNYLNLTLFNGQFTPEYIVSVDIASQQLFGDASYQYTDKVNLCIDHHGSNSGFAQAMVLDDSAAATCEIVYDLLVAMGVEINQQIANCLYTGISTDTGCFKFANTTARTHRVAARLIDLGAECEMINELMFENKTRERIAIEQIALSALEYHFGGKCALVCLNKEQIEATGAVTSDLEGITGMPRSIDGVSVGIMMRQLPGGSYKISVRTRDDIDACAICTGLGGGGHKQAAGCEIIGGMEYAKNAILDETKKIMEQQGISVSPQEEQA